MSESIQSDWLLRNYSRVAVFSVAVAVLGALAAILSGTGYRLDIWDRGLAFTILRYGAVVAGAGGALCLIVAIVSIVLHKGEFFTRSAAVVAGLVVGVFAFYVPYSMQQTARAVPPIHDITTDINNPPAFEAALALREATGASNPADYVREVTVRGGSLNVPEAQREAYPDIQPMELYGRSFYEGFDLALEASESMGWTIIAADRERGRIEAWNKTTWYGFIDDVVVRITPEGIGSMVDVRSVSRVGTSDVGKNAQRIRAYFKTLEAMDQ
jgi:uncharacterized protein (DUF1499 family)